MRIGRLAAAGAFFFVLIGVALPLSAQNFATDIPLPSGGSERVLFAAPAAPHAILIMFPGATGIVEISASGTTTNRNFLVRTLPLWFAQGFAVEVLGSPNGASLLGQRHTPGYLVAIDRAVDFARSRANAPIWLVGTSQGSTAAANGAAHLGGKIAGLVLTSSVTRPNRSGETVFDSEPGLIAQPALIVANQGDTCRATPPFRWPRTRRTRSRGGSHEPFQAACSRWSPRAHGRPWLSEAEERGTGIPGGKGLQIVLMSKPPYVVPSTTRRDLTVGFGMGAVPRPPRT